jgi:hypothetical protein
MFAYQPLQAVASRHVESASSRNGRPYIAAAGNHVFKLAVRTKLVQPWDEPVSGSYQMLPGPGGARAEAERRRWAAAFSS